MGQQPFGKAPRLRVIFAVTMGQQRPVWATNGGIYQWREQAIWLSNWLMAWAPAS
jgi:hypothetical protein